MMILSSAADRVLARLEERSKRERSELEALSARGAKLTQIPASRLMLDVGPDVGRLLNLLVRCGGAQQVLEVGGSVGYSTIWLADAVAATGGEVVSIDTDAGKVEELRRSIEEAGLRPGRQHSPACGHH